MADLESLINADELKWGYMLELVKSKRHGIWSRYNSDADMMILLFSSPEQESIVFYVDGNVGLLVDPETMNVVGFQIEAFRKSFLPNHQEVDKVWHLAGTDVRPADFSDLTLSFEQTQRRVAREIVRATEGFVDEPLEDLVAALA